ncbi:MAG: hypothetical protein WBV96_23515 [Polyangia bacterium]
MPKDTSAKVPSSRDGDELAQTVEPGAIDFGPLRDQVANDRNGGVRLCPLFDPNAVAVAIDTLPDTLAADDSTWCSGPANFACSDASAAGQKLLRGCHAAC